MNNIVSLAVQIEGIGETRMSFDITELLGKLAVEQLMYPCPENHSQTEIDDVEFVCLQCGGTGLMLHPAGKVLAEVIHREDIKVGKTMVQISKEDAQQHEVGIAAA